MKRWKKVFLIAGLTSIGAFLGFFAWLKSYVPDTFSVTSGAQLTLAQLPYVKAHDTASSSTQMVDASVNDGRRSVKLTLFGFVPLKTVWVQETAPQTVMVSGAPFGIKLFSDGVMVVGFSDIYTATGYQNPAKSAGIRMGDTLHSINGTKVYTNEDIQRCVEESDGRPICISYSRKGKEDTLFLTPVQDTTGGNYRIGMWVRDSSAGIGTLTYYDTKSGLFAGLGHAVTDVDSGESIEVLTGQIVGVTITGVAPSSAGSPGELKGVLSPEKAGDILGNDQTGVFGKLADGAASTFTGQALPVACRQEATVGEAVVYTCINGNTPCAYRVEIERISYNESTPNKNMIVHILDETLLEQTGGIVQGMSGSPIVQNGKLIGAVTHVLVNDPTRGYAIFAENMVEAQQQWESDSVSPAA